MKTRRWIPASVVAILGIVVIGALVVYNRRADTDIRSQMYVPKNSPITPEIALLQSYVRIDTSNPPGLELAGARFLAGLLEKHGLKAEIIESAPGRANVYARLEGKRRGEGLLLMNHIDVVPAPPKGWYRPPFAAAIAVNQLWGRGSLDMKSIAICELQAFLDVARSGRQPERDIIFLGVADEELGGAFGTKWLLQHRPELFQGVRYALNEGGITETRQERLSYFGVEIGTKMNVRARLRAPAREQMQRARIALEPYLSKPDPDRILPEVREFLREIAPLRIEQQPLLIDIDRTVADGKFWLLSRGYKELMQNIVWLGGVGADNRGATMEVNLFNLPDEDPDRRIAWLKSMLAPYGATVEEVLEKNGPAPISSVHTPLFALLKRAVQQQYGQVPVGSQILAAASNDSRYLRARGITCYGLWPFPVDFYQSQGIHSIDERVRLDWFMQGVAMMRQLVRQYAFEPLPQ
jgi:acetylornithine deacetylase/succinyl-diaminopimelate desuccinylase-like protein